MSESIAEMILPGTYIEVRSEGLIAVGSIATGNIGIVGTAARGPILEPTQIGGLVEAIDTFGPDDLVSTQPVGGTPLTLVRALRQVFAGGGSNIHAVRIAGGAAVAASRTIPASADDAFRLTAKELGSYGNDIQVVVVDNGASAPPPRLRVSITYRTQREVFEGNNVSQLRTALAGSQLVDVGAGATPADGNALVPPFTGNLQNGDSVPLVNSGHVADGLATLEDEPVNIVVVAGLGASVAAAPLIAHVDRTENDGRERVALVGASASDVNTVDNDAGGIADDRMILVAPGLNVTEPGLTPGTSVTVSLNPSYTAALIAGRLAAIAPHISLTNQTLPISELDVNYTTTVHRGLLQNRVMTVRRRFGFQIVRGISTDPGAFSQISVRRIVDYAKAGVRLGSNPYIGKLNNVRVRAALKATLDGFLSQMVVDEMLTEYQLDVTATREQEIRGIASVVMTLQPTFSIDFIRVTMNLQ